MKKLASFSLAVLIGFCLLVATDRNAWGYVDPGTGLLALQSFASVVAAAGYFMRRKILGLFGSRSSKKPAQRAVVRVAIKPNDSRNAA